MRLAQTLGAAPWVKVSLAAAAIIILTSTGRPLPVKLTGAAVKMTGAALRRHSPIRIRRQVDQAAWESSNWSGYAVTNGTVSNVSNSWIVPAVNCTIAPDGYSSFWVGIDGFNSNTVEQIGTDSDCVSLDGTQTGVPTYYAWFEFYPQGAFLIEFTRGIQPGDVIVADVRAVGKGTGIYKNTERFTVTIVDVTQNETFSTTSPVPGSKQSSAEWIAEAPCCQTSGAFLPLSNFGTVNFGVDYTTVPYTAFAIINNALAPIGKFGANNIQQITMVTENTPTATKAQPSGLSKDGTSFSVAWFNAGP